MYYFKYYILLFLVTIIWGSSFFFIKQSLNTINSYEFLFLRFFTATIVIAPFLLFNMRKIKLYDVVAGGLIGIFLFLVLLITNISLEYLSSAKVAIYTGMSVIVIAIIDTLILKKLSKLILFSVCCSFIGLLLILELSSFSLQIGDSLGLILCTVIAIHFILTEKVTQNANSFLIGVVQIYFAMILSFCSLLLFSTGLKNLHIISLFNNKEILFSIIYTGALGTALAFIIQTICINKVSSIKAAVIFNFEPVVGLFFPVLMAYYLNIENKLFTSVQFFGFFLIIISMFTTIFDKKRV